MKKVTLKIEAKGTPGSGKTRALNCIKKALREQFTVNESLGMIGENERYIELELELKRNA